jgi:hypothetical protein
MESCECALAKQLALEELPDAYFKYMACAIAFFVTDDMNESLRIVKPILNDSSEFMYNYDSDLTKRCHNLFTRLVELMTEASGGQFFMTVWHILHIAPVLASHRNDYMLEYLYKDYIFDTLNCVSCISHYIGHFTTAPKDLLDGSNNDQLCNFIHNLHNDVRSIKGKTHVTKEDSNRVCEYIIKKVNTFLPTQ